MGQVLAWLEHRLGVVSAWHAFADRPVRGGVRLRHSFATVVVFLVLMQAVLGLTLAIYYSPSATDAWASTAYIQDKVMVGWFIRGLHYHGASAMVVVSAAWMLSQVMHRGYRAPREFAFWGAIGVFAISLALGLTGNPLPWDEEGFWSIQVELSIAEQTPNGEMVRTLVQGGSDAGNFSVLRLYVLHAFVLPAALAGLVVLVVKQLRRHGDPPPQGMSPVEADRRAQRYFPGQLLIDLLMIWLVVAVIIGLTIGTHGAELMAPADPTSGFQARPAWYFLFLYKLRMLFEGPLEPVATMVLPGAAAGFLVAIPFIDQYGGKAGRALVLIGFGALAMGVMAMTAVAITSDRANEDYQKAVKLAHKNAARALDLAKTGVQAQGGLAVFWNDPEYKVKMLYKEHCQNCHAIDGEGGDEAPNLTDYSSRAWLTALVRNPNDPRFFGGTKHDSMDPYPEKDLPQEQLDAAVEYVVSLMGDPSMQVDDTLAATGKTLWEDELDCNSCHEVEAGEDGDGPNLLGHGSSAWAARVIRDSSKPDLFGEAAQMPKFGDKLSDEQIEQLAAFVVSQRAAKPADDEEAEAEETTPEENGAEAEPEEAEPVEAEPEAAEPEEAEPED